MKCWNQLKVFYVRQKALDDYKLKILNSFSSKAKTYDLYAKIQKVVAERMIERLDVINFNPKNILDLGCGTGLLTALLNKKYNSSNIISVDFSSAMLNTCKEKNITSSLICADIECLPFKSMNFDLIISNFTLHWCQNLQRIFFDVRNNLNDQGIFFFSTLGPGSLNELREAFLKVDNSDHVNKFIDMHHYGDMLTQLNFVDPVMDIENITLKFSNFFDAVNSIRKIGANVLLDESQKPLTKTEVKTLIDSFPKSSDMKYPLTYEVIYGTAWSKKTMSHDDNRVVIPIKEKK